uniref:Uncharacterized protein n=1 Tax=Avena sativa TaxID=4498 RepID=A0ACD5TX25_AVESA
MEAAWPEGDLELPKNALGDNMLHMLACPKDVSSDCAVEAAMEEDYRLRMGFVDDYVCAICDEGGNLIWCEGDCGRLFHPTKPDGVHSKCQTLGLSKEQVEQVFLCKNCEYKQHQCVVCRHLGSSDISSDFKYTEVFQCNKKGCKRFYHPDCMERDYNKRPQDFECPMHECWSCKNKGRKAAGEHATPEGNERITTQRKGRKPRGMHLVQCRRCSKAYHQKCLPRRIAYRKWTTTGGRMLFYCKDHKMAKGLRSAKRDHLKFPEIAVENGTSSQGASEKRSVPEGQAGHVNKESDPASENRDKIPKKTHKGNLDD